MNEWTHFFMKIYLSHFILERIEISCVWEVSWKQGETVTYWPKVLLTIASLLPHSRWVAQPWVTEGPSPLSGAGSHSAGILSPTGTDWLPKAICGTWLYNCLMPTCFLLVYAPATITEFNHVHRSRWYSDIFSQMHLFRCSSAYLHRCISWLMARLRVNMLHLELWGLVWFYGISAIVSYSMPNPVYKSYIQCICVNTFCW